MQIHVRMLKIAIFSAVCIFEPDNLLASGEYGTPAEAEAMLEKAVAAVTQDKQEALVMFSKGGGGFRYKDLYPYCGGPDGNFTAHPTLVGKSLKDLRDVSGKAFGSDIYAVALEGKITEVSYIWLRPGGTEPVQKVAYVTKVGDQVCAVGFYKDGGGGRNLSEPGGVVPTAEQQPIDVYFVKTTRMFSGPKQYPPRHYGAYGIVVFKAQATQQTRSRYAMMCEAYIRTIPHFSETKLPPAKQMVTAWPIADDMLADEINKMIKHGIPAARTCDRAVDSYGLVLALKALEDARGTGEKFRGNGPFLLAWAPGEKKGNPDALVLFEDLSGVSTEEGAIVKFQRWRDNIEQSPELWENGWSYEEFMERLRRWVDKEGTVYYKLVGAPE